MSLPMEHRRLCEEFCEVVRQASVFDGRSLWRRCITNSSSSLWFCLFRFNLFLPQLLLPLPINRGPSSTQILPRDSELADPTVCQQELGWTLIGGFEPLLVADAARLQLLLTYDCLSNIPTSLDIASRLQTLSPSTRPHISRFIEEQTRTS